MLFISSLIATAAAHNAFYREDHRCQNAAGLFQLRDVVDEYDNSEVGTGTDFSNCTSGAGILLIRADCSWEAKRARFVLGVDANTTLECESQGNYFGNEVVETESEFYKIPGGFGRNGESFVFTVSHVNEGRRLVGVIEEVNGCSLSVSGWAEDTEADEIYPCTSGFHNEEPRFEKKRQARLTDEDTTSVSVSDIKDALALISGNIRDWKTTTESVDGTSESDIHEPCGAFAGVYQTGEDVSDFQATGTALEPCSGGISYIQIRGDCSWTYKTVRTSSGDPEIASECLETSGFGETALVTYQADFCHGSDEANTLEILFSVRRSADGPTRIAGVIENTDTGCTISFDGARTSRDQVHPCRDRIEEEA